MSRARARARARALPLIGALLGAGGLPLLAAPASSAPPAGAPHIVARPDSVMVNTSTTLIGRNFRPHTTIRLRECSVRTWVVTANPCASGNGVTVATNAKGAFKTSMVAEVCPGVGSTPPPGFAEICYIGEPVPQGVDTITLVGAVRITVTGP
jgi:hypothetical protein